MVIKWPNRQGMYSISANQKGVEGKEKKKHLLHAVGLLDRRPNLVYAGHGDKLRKLKRRLLNTTLALQILALLTPVPWNRHRVAVRLGTEGGVKTTLVSIHSCHVHSHAVTWILEIGARIQPGEACYMPQVDLKCRIQIITFKICQ